MFQLLTKGLREAEMPSRSVDAVQEKAWLLICLQGLWFPGQHGMVLILNVVKPSLGYHWDKDGLVLMGPASRERVIMASGVG